jgi:peptidoglycan hydrolase-like protein with peptidoglycan-binding domain
MKKIDKRVWWSVPIILGIYLIFRQYSKNKTIDVIEPVIEPTTAKETTNSSYSSSYPLKIGSRDAGSPLNPKGLVVELQKLINTKGYIPYNKLAPFTKLSEDGIFGSKTENAVLFWTGSKSIDDESDLQGLKNALTNKIPFSNTQLLF